jgi:hypothetical protein
MSEVIELHTPSPTRCGVPKRQCGEDAISLMHGYPVMAAWRGGQARCKYDFEYGTSMLRS